MLSLAARDPGRDRPRPTALRVGVVAAVLALAGAGCGVLELGDAGHDAVLLESAVPTDDGRWHLIVELLQTDIEGQAVVAVAVEGDDVSCVEGGSVPTGELAPPMELRFEQGREGVERGADEDEPPVVSGVALEADCD